MPEAMAGRMRSLQEPMTGMIGHMEHSQGDMMSESMLMSGTMPTMEGMKAMEGIEGMNHSVKGGGHARSISALT
jgi:hypothetical protein